MHQLKLKQKSNISCVCLSRSNAERGTSYFLTHASVLLYNKLRLTTQLSPSLLSSSEVSFGTPRQAAKRTWVVKMPTTIYSKDSKKVERWFCWEVMSFEDNNLFRFLQYQGLSSHIYGFKCSD